MSRVFPPLAAVLAGVALAIAQPPRPTPAGKPESPARPATPAATKRSLDNLHKLANAWMNYDTVVGQAPTSGRDPAVRPLLSWRVRVLPYLEHIALYQKFKPDEPWDGPTNKPLLAQMPAEFRTAFQPADATATYYQAFVGPGTVSAVYARRRPPSQEWRGAGRTLVVAEVGPPVPWTKPDDVAYDPAKPLPPVVWPFADLQHLAAGNGVAYAVRPATLTEDRLRQLIEAADGRAGPGFDGLVVDRLPPPATLRTTPTAK